MRLFGNCTVFPDTALEMVDSCTLSSFGNFSAGEGLHFFFARNDVIFLQHYQFFKHQAQSVRALLDAFYQQRGFF